MPNGALPVLDVQGLKTVFKTRGGEVHAVNDVSFNLKAGELLGVVGESGSGKTTLLRALLGLVPAAGDVRDGIEALLRRVRSLDRLSSDLMLDTYERDIGGD